MFNLIILLISGLYFALASAPTQAAKNQLTLNDLEYFEKPGLNVFVFNNWYNGLFSDSKMSGIEIIHHGVRTATNGDLRLHATPEQWDPIPEFINKEVNKENSTVEAFLQYSKYDFTFSIRAKAKDNLIQLSVHLPKPLPNELIGQAGLNLEFLPASYLENGYIADNKAGIFPLYPSGLKEVNGKVTPEPLAEGKKLILAPANQERQISIESKNHPLKLYDGRAKAQNGWFVVRSLLPANKAGKVLEWTIKANTKNNWSRPPMIAHSQVGYHPKQKKIATIEIDKNSKKTGNKAVLYRTDQSGATKSVYKTKPTLWGRYKRYDYLTFDFSHIKEPGLYTISYQGVTTAPFRIADNIYNDVWHPTLDVFFPVQMDHLLVNEAYRVWHGASHLDDALQAPVNHTHFDLYAQGPETDTVYKPGDHIPGLNIGGWYDAGDYDIRTQTQYYTVNDLVKVWETFAPVRDTTSISYDKKFVDIHVADGKPDILQQIEHGTLALVAQFRAVGHAIPGIIVPDISQYTHLGDGLTMTDNLIFDANMSELESDGVKSGVFDDRWAFTSESTALNYGSIAALAAASRALRNHNEELANECLEIAKRVWTQEEGRKPKLFKHGNTTGGPLAYEHLRAATELLLTTKDKKYTLSIESMLPEIERDFRRTAILAVQVLPHMGSAFKEKITDLAKVFRLELDKENVSNPFGVTITEGGWAGNGTIIRNAISYYYLHKTFPKIFEAELVFKGLNYIFGHHPGSNLSFVSNVGTRSKKVAYGMNRADHSFISGGVVPGVLIVKPDFPENKDDWPFLWGENEYVINVGGAYIFLANAAHELLTNSK